MFEAMVCQIMTRIASNNLFENGMKNIGNAKNKRVYKNKSKI